MKTKEKSKSGLKKVSSILWIASLVLSLGVILYSRVLLTKNPESDLYSLVGAFGLIITVTVSFLRPLSEELLLKYFRKIILYELILALGFFFAYKFVAYPKEIMNYTTFLFVGTICMIILWLLIMLRLTKKINQLNAVKKEKEWSESYDLRKAALSELYFRVSEEYRYFFLSEDYSKNPEFGLLVSKGFFTLVELPTESYVFLVSKQNLEKIKSKIDIEKFIFDFSGKVTEEMLEKYSNLLFR